MLLATRILVCSDGDAHPRFKEMHFGKREEDLEIITSTVKGMKARAIRNSFTDRLGEGKASPPRAKAWFYCRQGYRGRRESCIDCPAKDHCHCRDSNFKESFCIIDALLRAGVGDVEHGLFYSGSSVTRIPEPSLAELTDARRLILRLDEELEQWEEVST